MAKHRFPVIVSKEYNQSMDFSTLLEFPEDKKNEWNAFITSGVSHVPFLRFEYLQNWWQTRGGGEWSQEAQLAIITAHESDRLIGIAPCFIAEHDGKKAYHRQFVAPQPVQGISEKGHAGLIDLLLAFLFLSSRLK